MAHRREHPVVAEWVDDHCHAGVVLGGGPHHRRAADVDLFDAFVDAGAGVDGFGERIQVDDDELEGGDAELLERRGVFGFAQIRQQSGVHARVQCLDPAVEHFGETGQLLDPGHRNAFLGNDLRGGTGRDDLDARLGQPLGELDQTGLVVHADQGATDRPFGVFPPVVGAHRLVAFHPIVAFLPTRVRPPVAIAATTSTSSLRSVTLMRSCNVCSSSPSSTGTDC